MGFLEGKHSAHTDEESVEGEQFGCLLLISGKAVEDTATQLVAVFLKYAHHLVLCLAAVDHERQTGFDCPPHLLLKTFHLLALIFATPVEVKPHLSDCDKLSWRCLLNVAHF